MPVRRAKKIRIAIVGAGNLADALAVSLRAAGYSIDLIVSRRRATSMRRVRRLAREVGAFVVTTDRMQIQAEVIWFCVPDGAIAGAAESLGEATNWKGRVALHSSGALTSGELEVLRKRGAEAASVHPLMTFVRGSRPPLAGVPFAVEGDAKAARTARAIVLDLGGNPFTMRKASKELYHAWGTFASPLLTALLATAENVAVAAGIDRKSARQRMLPILRQTLANYERLGARGAFSGPIIRGDVATLKKHLAALRTVAGAREVYVALARAALRDMPVKNRAALEKLLER